ncbi:SRPBCC family protein [Nocardiopsis sp. RSe5-2]|uniref:SRPBCC family protein n=1 Tax=Nocardiopsis endophytica TaxID=3018445 RepID=A0ABT4U034_9ACTN|nr:SRPBCC family protein [Nocardiopsis endophytica]MDA2810313.1 SRPBCC family protein [Nocardiopsis endophytica]
MYSIEDRTVEVETRIGAAPARVWTLASDISVPPRFSGELLETGWLDGADGPRVGARFAGRNRNGYMGEWTTTSEVVEVDEPRTFAWDVLLPDGRRVAAWRFDLRAEDGGTVLRLSMRVGPDRSPVDDTYESDPEKGPRLVGKRLRMLEGGMRATVEGIRGLAEA